MEQLDQSHGDDWIESIHESKFYDQLPLEDLAGKHSTSFFHRNTIFHNVTDALNADRTL